MLYPRQRQYNNSDFQYVSTNKNHMYIGSTTFMSIMRSRIYVIQSFAT